MRKHLNLLFNKGDFKRIINTLFIFLKGITIINSY